MKFDKQGKRASDIIKVTIREFIKDNLGTSLTEAKEAQLREELATKIELALKKEMDVQEDEREWLFDSECELIAAVIVHVSSFYGHVVPKSAS
jgi:hypothetical protein